MSHFIPLGAAGNTCAIVFPGLAACVVSGVYIERGISFFPSSCFGIVAGGFNPLTHSKQLVEA